MANIKLGEILKTIKANQVIDYIISLKNNLKVKKE